MTRFCFLVVLFLLFSCKSEISVVNQDDEILLQDLSNKQYELNILRELYIAQQNNDEDAFVFYVSEYIRVPRLKLSAAQKNHKLYKEWISDEIIKSGEFMDTKYNYLQNEAN